MDDSLRTLIEEIQAMDDNTIMFPLYEENVIQPQQQQQTLPEQQEIKETNDSSAQTNMTGNGWIMRPASDYPSINWIDSGYQYSVQNPANHGKYLLKLNLFNNNRPVHSSGIYINDNKNDKVFIALQGLLNELENLWIHRDNGTPKVAGLVQTISPIPVWRQISSSSVLAGNTSRVGNNRKRRAAAAK